MKRHRYYVIDARKRTGAAVASYRYEWCARLHAKIARLEYDQPIESYRWKV